MAVLAFAAVLLATPYIGMVQAKAPTPVLFGAMLTGVDFATMEYRQNGPNWVAQYISFGYLFGGIEGDFIGEPYWIFHHWVGPYEDPFMLTMERGNGHVLLTVDVTEVMGEEVTGTLTLKFNDVWGSDFAGTWVIVGGTNDLKSLHGQGTWIVPGIVDDIECQAFEGEIHFDP